jgi:hypothetical protein
VAPNAPKPVPVDGGGCPNAFVVVGVVDGVEAVVAALWLSELFVACLYASFRLSNAFA